MFRPVGRFLFRLGARFRALRRPRAALASLALLLGISSLVVAGYVRTQRREAEADIDANRPADARRRLEKCLQFWPWTADLHRLAGRAARMDGDLTAAEAHLKLALKASGEATESLQLEFLLLRVQAGELDEVVSALSDTVEKGHPDAPMILETVARAYIVQLRYRPAFVCLSRWLELRPGTARAYQWRGWVAERLNNYTLAAENYRKALDYEPELVMPQLRLAELLLEEKRAPEAIPYLERLAETDPDNAHVQSRLGICRFLQGDLVGARRLLEGAAPKLPGDPVLRVNLARLELAEGRYAEAEKWLREIFASDPTDNEARYMMITVYQLRGELANADRALQEYNEYKKKVDRVNSLLKDAVENPATGPEEFAEIGEFLLLIGRDETARYWLDKALGRDSEHGRSHRAMAAYYEKKGNAEAAAFHRGKLRNP